MSVAGLLEKLRMRACVCMYLCKGHSLFIRCLSLQFKCLNTVKMVYDFMVYLLNLNLKLGLVLQYEIVQKLVFVEKLFFTRFPFL